MPRVAPEAQKSRGLMQQIVSDGPMRFMTNRAILCNGRVFVGKRTLFLRMTLVTDHVQGRFFQVSLCLAMSVVAIGAHQLAFLDGMVRRHGGLGIDARMALVTDARFVDGHG